MNKMIRIVNSALLLLVPTVAQAQLSNSQKSELYYKNYLVNSAADHGKAGWTSSGGTFGVDTSSQFQDSVNSFSFDPSASGQYVQQVIGAPVSLKGKTCIAQIDYLGFDSNMELRLTDGTNDLVTPAVLSAASGTPGHAKLVFPCKTTAGNMVWRLESLGNAAVGYYKSYFGEAPASALVSQAQDIGSAVTTAATNCQWTVTAGGFTSFPADTDCNSPTTTGKLAAPATKIPGAVLSSVAPGTYIVTAMFVGNYASNNCTFRLYDGTNSSGSQLLGSAAKGVTLVGRFEYTTAQNSITWQVQAQNDNGAASCYIDNNYPAGAETFEIKVQRVPSSTDTIVGSANQFKISSYLQGRSAVTTTPAAMGEYRVRYKTTASAQTTADASGYTTPTSTDGMKIYGNVPYTSAGTASQPGVWDIYIGPGKEGKFRVDFYSGTGKSGKVDTTFLTSGSNELGAIKAYDNSTGVLTVDATIAWGGSSTRYLGHIPGTSGTTAASGYFEVTVADNAALVGADLINTTASWSGYFDYTCSWGSSGTTWTDFATGDATCVFGTRTSKNLTVTSYKDGSNNPLPGIVFTPPGPRTYYVCASPKIDQSSDGSQVAVRMVDGSGTVIADVQKAGLGNNRITQSICGIYSTVSTSAVTLKLQQKNATGSTTLATNAPNASGTDSSIEWSIFDITQANTATGGNVYTGTAANNWSIESVRLSAVCSSGTCALGDSSPGISSVAWSSTGVYIVNFVSGTFSSRPTCAVAEGQSTNQVISVYNGSSSLVNVSTVTASTNAFANGQFGLICHGRK